MMTRTFAARFAFACLAAVSTVGLLTACSDDVDETPTGGETYTKPVYGISSLRFTDQGTSSTFIALLDSLETQGTVKLADTREFDKYSAANTFGGKIITSDGNAPKLTRWAVSDSHTWTEETSAGFGAYGNASLTLSTFVDATTAYSPSDANNFVKWNPT
ncbi:hypothetical protein EON77_06250, partial [bacterium]